MVVLSVSDTDINGCPKCGFAHYGARFVYGDAAYRYAKSQKPWLERRIAEYSYKLRKEIDDQPQKNKKIPELKLFINNSRGD